MTTLLILAAIWLIAVAFVLLFFAGARLLDERAEMRRPTMTPSELARRHARGERWVPVERGE